GDLQLRRGDDVDVVVADRLAVIVGQRLAEGLGAADVLAELGFEDAPGRLARAEPGELHLPGDPAERLIDVLFEFGLVDLDRKADLVAFQCLDGGLHRRGIFPAPPPASGIYAVGEGGLEPPASCSQSRCATNCATP